MDSCFALISHGAHQYGRAGESPCLEDSFLLPRWAQSTPFRVNNNYWYELHPLLPMVYYETIWRQTPGWLAGLIGSGSAAPVSQGQGLNRGKPDFYFSGFLSATAFLTNLTARIFSTNILNSRVFKTKNILRQHLEKWEEQIPITQTIFPDLLPLPV